MKTEQEEQALVSTGMDFINVNPVFNQRKKETMQISRSSSYPPCSSSLSPAIEIIELRVCKFGDGCVVISITCTKKRDTMIKMDDLDCYQLEKMIRAAIEGVDAPMSLMSISY
ncbi:hypothetical protein J5N97_003505 [Dioscorea zingiberensis]|uniref:Uncharacterized protein n=1 Tax=Dioscorea zingiberensis TaxID=325984 RepID=A0A9D5D5Y7_9LILI|nr:hypothetical protein J5N97_003505 [Dioscorea zingiberensis]